MGAWRSFLSTGVHYNSLTSHHIVYNFFFWNLLTQMIELFLDYVNDSYAQLPTSSVGAENAAVQTVSLLCRKTLGPSCIIFEIHFGKVLLLWLFKYLRSYNEVFISGFHLIT